MAESNATQVILTDDGIKIINAQNTADNAASQAGNADSAALIAQSTANAAKEAADSTYAYANSEIAVQSTATAKAQSTADNAFSQAQAVGSQASAEINNNSTATAKAQSAADNAFSQATTAIDNGKVTSQAVTDLKDGSKLTIADLENGLATKVANSEYASYKVQTASQIAQKVDNGAFSAYKTQTADLIAQKVANSDFSAYQATTAKSIESKVESSDFNTYKTQTANLIDDKVSSSEYASDKTQTASEIADRVSNSAFSTYQTQTASQIAQKVDNGAFSAYQSTTADLIASKVATKDFSAYQATTAKAISSKVESSDFKTYQTQTADMIASKVSKSDANNVNLIPYSSHFTTPLTGWTLMNWGATDRKLLVTTHTFYQNGTGALLYLNTAQNGTAAAGSNRFPLLPNTTYTFQFKAFASSNVVGANVYLLSRAYGSTSDYDTVHGLFKNLVTSPSQIDQYTVTFTTGANDNEGYIRVDNIGSNNSASSGLFFTELKLELGDTATPYVYGGQDSMIAQTSDDVLIKVSKDELIDEINLQAGNTLISSSGQLTLAADTIYFDTNKPVIIPSANITGTLNGKTITGSTINGTTFNAGNKLNQYGNTSYPLTINQDGSVTSTSFGNIANDPAALRTVIKDGSVKTNFRGMKQLSTGIYPAADIAMGAGQLALLEGYSTSQDPNFTATGLKTTGYAILDASAGLSLHGTTQAINFSGTDQNQTTGITMNSYGNIIGYPNATWWRIVSNSGSNVANFGIDSAGSNVIQFNRELDIGNFHINTGHTFTSWDKGAIHFAKGGGGAADIYAGAVHYTSLVKSSLLSVKKDVQKADTAYWAQLVNSIDLATYQYKTDDNTSHLRLSSIVDDVNVTKQWQLPDVFISRDEDGKLCGVDDSVLLNATLATVQEQQKEIDQLNGHNMELEARLNKLEAKLNG
ncbi:phage tail protein [Lactiplantibacillus pentosus]|uniref:carbohydrate binding domain-containing protein n=1 Tax=Lactiplantibacillus pentosus TaxID=1589 RepID=UPI00270DF9B9|nr:carbohydrate binding domain-containing protein [Lactiplantibacillus pentosus]MDO7806459.1 phage tail protein [Lactiplantibacillus pentosus]